MKKILCIATIIFVFAFNVFASSTNTYIFHDGGNTKQLRITITCGAGTATATVTKIPYNFRGYILTSVETYYGSTGMTDDSDLLIYQHSGTAGKDILNGAGTNMLDNATNNTFKPWINSTEAFALVTGDLYITFSNNSVDAAIVEVVLNFIKA